MSVNDVSELRLKIQPLREQLMDHPVYTMVDSVKRLRVFMEQHVFAVWDFMSLLKALQLSHTGISVPWVPNSNRTIARFVNEIVLGEETDEDGHGGYISHFELYRDAMHQIGASTMPIDSLVSSLKCGVDMEHALIVSGAKTGARQFVRTTWSIVTAAKSHCIAAAFSLGREDVIPDMFRKFIDSLDDDSPGQFERMKYYLRRHIEVDEGSHGPMALKTICELCGNDTKRWGEATDAASAALRARIQLWDAIVAAMKEQAAKDLRNTVAEEAASPSRPYV